MHIMMDIETLGNVPGDAVVQIGLVEFDPFIPLEFGRTAEFHIDLGLAMRSGAAVDADTLRWWMTQSEAARRRVFGHPELAKPAYTVLEQMRAWWPDPNTPLWAHGAAYDPPMVLAALSGATRAEMPWKYRAVRDTRTLYDLVGGRPEPMIKGVEHDAVDDAKMQATQVQQAFLFLRNLLPDLADPANPTPVRGTPLGVFAEAIGCPVQEV